MSKFRVCFCIWRSFRQAKEEAPAAVRDLFERYSENGAMGAEQLKRFLVEVQGEEEGATTKVEAQAIIDSVLRDSKHQIRFPKKDGGSLGLDGFFRYLFGEANPPISPSLGVHHDMTAPLSHYFIYTSHNTYLTGNQLNSDCSDVPIIEALKRGVRVIELDMWPNFTNDGVDIYHGRTLTKPVELIKCLTSIKEHAFSASEYPVIITLEDHLTPDLQAEVAKMVTQIFGDLLFYPMLDGMEEFPSPEQLKMQIILSTKPPKEYRESKITTDKGSGSINAKEDDEEAWGKEVPDLKSHLDNEDRNDRDGSEHIHDEEDHDDDDPTSNKTTAPEYKRLITIHAGKPKGGLHEALREDPHKVRRLSLSEQELVKASESHSMELVRFNKENLVRVYPKGTRFTSSNYRPLIGWMHGAQMVALNMQGFDIMPGAICQPKTLLRQLSGVNCLHRELFILCLHFNDNTSTAKAKQSFFLENCISCKGINADEVCQKCVSPMCGYIGKGFGRSLWLMHGKFRANGGCGYVKKPEFLLKEDENGHVFDPKAKLPVKKTLKVKIYMGDGWNLDFHQTDFDMYSPPDFYTTVEIDGVPADTILQKTKIIEDNWIPVWNEEFTFPLTVPELALLRIEVCDYDPLEMDGFGGQTCLLVPELRTGVRAVPLCNRKGEEYKSVKLLMQFEFV